jgi:hypothetical protein
VVVPPGVAVLDGISLLGDKKYRKRRDELVDPA